VNISRIRSVCPYVRQSAWRPSALDGQIYAEGYCQFCTSPPARHSNFVKFGHFAHLRLLRLLTSLRLCYQGYQCYRRCYGYIVPIVATVHYIVGTWYRGHCGYQSSVAICFSEEARRNSFYVRCLSLCSTKQSLTQFALNVTISNLFHPQFSN